MNTSSIRQTALRCTVAAGIVIGMSVATVAPAYADHQSDCTPPPASASPGSQEYEDWAVDQYVYGCTDASIAAENPWYTTNDGYASTSIYIGKRMTSEINDWMERNGDGGAARAGLASVVGCGGLAFANAPAGFACGVVAAELVVNYSDVKDSARNAVKDGSCIKIRKWFNGRTDIDKTSSSNEFCIE